MDRVEISIIDTYSHNRIARNEAVGAIQSMKMHAQKSGGRFRAPAGVRRPFYGTAVLKAVRTFPSAVLSAPEIPLAFGAPNTAATAATIQKATMIYSNETTPSLSVLRRFNASVVLT